MKTISRAGGAVAALAVGAALALTPQSAQAATTPQAEDATSWLAGQLPDDHVIQSFGFPDFGLTIDFALAFQGTGTQDAALGDVVGALESNPATINEYTTNVGFKDRPDSQIAGATAKLATLVQLVDGDARDFASHDLIAEVEGLVADDGAAVGRAQDRSNFGENSNSIGQSFVVRSLSAADSEEAAAAADYLVKQQCDSGVFRINMTDTQCAEAGGTASIDTTAFAIEALAVNGDAKYGAAIAKAADFLVGAQNDDGSFTDTGADNSNSTGLAAAALHTAGKSAAATEAADFVASLQLPAGAGDDAGAIAYDKTAYEAAKATGVPDNLGDQFNRATAQAALGLLYATAPVDPGPGTDPDPDPEVGPVKTIELTVSDSTPTQGETITVTTTGKDADGDSAGDVSDDVTLTSSVDTDTVKGDQVTFNHASPHTITATYTDPDDATNVRTASVEVEVAPAAVADPVSGAAPSAVASGSLPSTGSTAQPWLLGLAAAMIVAGTALVAIRRRSSTTTVADR